MSTSPVPSRSAAVTVPWRRLLPAFVLLAPLLGAARAQTPIANPLMRPGPAAVRVDAPPPPPPNGARSAAERNPVVAAPTSSPATAPRSAVDEVPAAVLERVASLYVAAIVDGSAVLRSQLSIPQSGLAGQGGSPATANGGAAATHATPAGAAAGGAGGVSGAGAQGQGSFRSTSYVVHDSQPIRLFDSYRLLPRVDDEGVILYLLPPRERRGEVPRVVFRGLLTSVIGAPYVPSKGQLETPDGGLDGRARRDLSNVDRRIGAGSGAGSGTGGAAAGNDGRTGSGTVGSGSGSSTTNR